jgi:hypothetical protein
MPRKKHVAVFCQFNRFAVKRCMQWLRLRLWGRYGARTSDDQELRERVAGHCCGVKLADCVAKLCAKY